MKYIGKFIIALLATFIVFGIANKESTSATSIALTQDQKESNYQEYAKIVEEANATYNQDLELVPLEEFKLEEWVTPEEFKKIVTDMANLEFVYNYADNTNGLLLESSTTKTKSPTTTLIGNTVSISITGTFETQLVNDRQIFIDVYPVTSKVDSGTWAQTGYDAQIIDNGRTYDIYVGGKYTYNGVTTSLNVNVEFYCRSTGAVN